MSLSGLKKIPVSALRNFSQLSGKPCGKKKGVFLQIEENFQNKGNETGKKNQNFVNNFVRDIYIYREREREREKVLVIE